MIKTILNRIKIINYICFRVIFFKINYLCLNQDYFRCFFKIYLFKTCCFWIYSSHFWVIKSRVYLLLNVFIATKNHIYTKEKILNLTRILKRRKFIYRKKNSSWFLQSQCFSRLNNFLQKLMIMRWKRKKVNLFELRRRDYDKNSYCSFKEKRKSFFIDKKKKKTMLMNHKFYININIIFTTT
jgi:hypothetical protein